MGVAMNRPLQRKRRVRVFRWVAVSVLIVALLFGVGVIVCVTSADSKLSLLQRRPVAECSLAGLLPPRDLSSIEQHEVDHELVQHLLRDGEVKNRYIFILRSNFYDFALPLVRNPAQRRDLFARLPCYARPRLFDWRRST